MTHIHKVQRQPGNRVVVASPGPQGPSGGGTGGGGVGVNVTDYGAVGNGQSDDTDPIAAAIVAAGVGGTVFFPQGSYRISRPITPLQGQRLEGTYQSRYHAGLADPTSTTLGSMIAALPEFTGEALIVADEALEPRGVHLTRLAIVGPGETHASGCHGVKNDGGYGESSWWIEECLINSMPGHGITGHWWVFDMRDTHVSRCSWGLKLTGSDGMLDTRIIGCMFYFNRDGGVGLDGGWTGLIEFVACRVERSGNKYGYPFEPLNLNAPGFSITSAHQCVFTNCSTDANTGPGLHMVRKGSGTYLYNMEFQGCHFLRDGGGSKAWEDTEWWTWTDGLHQVAPPVQGTAPPDDVFPVTTSGLAGVYIGAGVTQSSFVNCSVGRGPHTDWPVVPPWGGEPILDGFSPQYGIKAENTTNVTVSNCQFDSPKGDLDAIVADDSNWQLNITSLHHRRMSLPVYWTETDMPDADVATGRVAYLANKRSLAVAGYGGEWHLIPAPTADAPVEFQKRIDILTTDADDSDGLVRFRRDGKSLWHVGHNPAIYTKSFYVVRYDVDGNYVDDPLAIDYVTGRVNLRHTYIESRTGAASTLAIQGFLDQTTPLTEWRNRTTTDGYSTVAGVRPDGRVWGQEATASNDYVTLSQLSGGATPEALSIGTDGSSGGYLKFLRGGVLRWQLGYNPDIYNNTFWIGRFDAAGAYIDDPIAINRDTGRVDLNHTYIESTTASASSLTVQGYQDQTTALQEWRSKTTATTDPEVTYSYDTVAGVRPDGRVWGTEGTSPNDFVTVSQLSGGDVTPTSLTIGTAGPGGLLRYTVNDVPYWVIGQNGSTYGHAFYLGRHDATGAYVDDPLVVDWSTGRVALNHTYIESTTASASSLTVQGYQDQTTALQEWRSKTTATTDPEVTYSYDTVAGVRPDGRVWGTEGTSPNDFVTVSQLSGGDVTPTSLTIGTAGPGGLLRYTVNDVPYWVIGQNGSTYGHAFYLGRHDATGAYVDDPLVVDWSTGRVALNHTYLRSSTPDASALVVRGAIGQTEDLQRWRTWDGTTETGVAGVRPDGRVWGAPATASGDLVTKSQLDAAVADAGTTGTLGPTVEVAGTAAQDKAFRFTSDDALVWQMGTNPSGTFYIWRPDALGNYLDTPLAINFATGRLTTLSQYIDAADPASTPFTVNAAASPTAPVFRVENSSGGALLEVTADSRVRSRWGSTTFGAVQQGCTQIVREGVAPGNTLLACYTSTANAAADISVFEVYGNGSVKIADATEANEAISLGQLQSVVAASSSWDDFKTRVAAL